MYHLLLTTIPGIESLERTSLFLTAVHIFEIGFPLPARLHLQNTSKIRTQRCAKNKGNQKFHGQQRNQKFQCEVLENSPRRLKNTKYYKFKNSQKFNMIA
jgi:hypothetical protein